MINFDSDGELQLIKRAQTEKVMYGVEVGVVSDRIEV